MRVADPGRFAGAIRAGVVVPVAFGIGDLAFDRSDAGLFAAFGSIAFLVFVDFGGSVRARLSAYVALAIAGAALISLGTLCSESTVVGTLTMFVIAFAIMFAGVLNGYVAAARAAAILAFVLALMVPAGAAEIGERLAGWGIAAVLSTAATLLLWPQRPRNAVRASAAESARALAALVEGGGGADRGRLGSTAHAALARTRQRFVSVQHRPSGTGGRTAALARVIDDLGWLGRLATGVADPWRAEGELGAARQAIERGVPAALRDAADELELPSGTAAEPSGAAAALEAAHEKLGNAALRRMSELAERGRRRSLKPRASSTRCFGCACCPS